MRMLVSVRDEAEARAAAGAGADFIDLKEPREGALGGLSPASIRAIVRLLRDRHPDLPVSATIGDVAADQRTLIEERVAAVGACGVDYVKVGIAGGNLRAARALLPALAASPYPVVPVFIADRGVDFATVALACELPFPALMADTQDKLAGSLFDCVPEAALLRFVAAVREAGKLVGLAGALREAHVPRLAALGPDFAGFRSAVCRGQRTDALDAGKVSGLAAVLREARLPAVPA